MKKLLFVAGISLLSVASFAQVQFGAQIGGNLASGTSKYEEGSITVDQDLKSKFGFLVGAVAEMPISSAISFRPELNFIQKGAKYEETIQGITIKDEITLNYLELPLNFVYNFDAGAGKFFVGLGPSIGFGLSGKAKYSETGFPEEEVDVKFDGEKNPTDGKRHLKAIDFGGNFLAGYKMANGLFINLGYTIGFSNIDPADNYTYKNNGFAIKLGYMFGGKSKEVEKK
jgi:hypothetical protein